MTQFEGVLMKVADAIPKKSITKQVEIFQAERISAFFFRQRPKIDSRRPYRNLINSFNI
jgi:hypothetical protein